MPRCPRERAESGIYHVVARGNGRQVLFETDSDRFALIKLLDAKRREFGIDILAWCLMSNHIHLLIRDDDCDLSKFMRSVMTSYAMRFNNKNGHVGHVFQNRFQSKPIENDDYLLNAVLYIHANPEEAGICQASDYEWSSCREYLGRSDAIHLADAACVLGLVGGVDAFEKLSRSGERRGDYRFEQRKRIPDEIAISLASAVLDGISLSDLKALSSERKGAYLKRLIGLGLNPNQLERLTGIGRRSVTRLVCLTLAGD